MTGKIKSLQSKLDKAKLASGDFFCILDELYLAVIADIAESFQQGIMPVYGKKNGVIMTISPSAKKQGMFQVTRYSNQVAFGDSQYNTIEDAVRDNNLIRAIRLSNEDAELQMQAIISNDGYFYNAA